MRLRGQKASAPISFSFDGRTVPALDGETVGAALAAAGVLALRRTESGAMRGLWCGMGPGCAHSAYSVSVACSSLNSREGGSPGVGPPFRA